MAWRDIGAKLAGLAIVGLWGDAAYARWLGVSFGQGCRIHTRHFGSEPFLITLGDRVSVARDVNFINHDGATWLVRDGKGRRESFGRITVGNDVFIGARSLILPGVSIGNRVIVGAGSVVTRSVPDGLVVAGNPAVALGTFDAYVAGKLDLPATSDLPAHDRRALAHAALRPFKPMLAPPQGQGP